MIALPPNVKRDLKLDREQSWIMLTELNHFMWPGSDVRPLSSGSPYYGAIPDWLFVRLRDAIGALIRGSGVKVTRRTE